MYSIQNPEDVLEDRGVLVFVPFSTHRREGVPAVPQELAREIPNARKTFEKISEGTGHSRDTYYYMGNGNTYILHRVKSSSKAGDVSIDMLNQGLDILEAESHDSERVLILGTGHAPADDYMKLLFREDSEVFFLERK